MSDGEFFQKLVAWVLPFVLITIVLGLISMHYQSVKGACKIVCDNAGAVDVQVTREELCACVMPDNSVKMMAR